MLFTQDTGDNNPWWHGACRCEDRDFQGQRGGQLCQRGGGDRSRYQRADLLQHRYQDDGRFDAQGNGAFTLADGTQLPLDGKIWYIGSNGAPVIFNTDNTVSTIRTVATRPRLLLFQTRESAALPASVQTNSVAPRAMALRASQNYGRWLGSRQHTRTVCQPDWQPTKPVACADAQAQVDATKAELQQLTSTYGERQKLPC